MTSSPADDPCHRPLAEYCGAACPSLDEVRAACSGYDPAFSSERECGGYVIVVCSEDGLGGSATYFDPATGELRAVIVGTDSPFACPGMDSGSLLTWYGDPPPEECWY